MPNVAVLRKKAKQMIDGLSEEKLKVALDLLLAVQEEAGSRPTEREATGRELTAQLKEAEGIVKKAVCEKQLNSQVSWEEIRRGV